MNPRRHISATAAAFVVAAGLLLPTPASASASAPASPKPARTTAAATGAPLFGASIYGPEDEARLSTLMGRPLTSVRAFFTSLPPSWSRSTLLASVPATSTVLLSFQSGTPAEVQAFLTGRPAGTTCYATYFHEPENDFVTATQKAAYLTSWDAYAPAIRAAGCTPTLVLMKWTLNKYSHRNYQDYYRPADIDLIAYDAYNAMADKGGYGEPISFLAPILAVAAETGKPWALAEIASYIPAGSTREARAAWAHSVAVTALASPSFRFADWWDMVSRDGSLDYRLDSPTALAWHA